MVEGVFIAGQGNRRQLIRAAGWVLGLLLLGTIAYGSGYALAR